MRIIGGKAEHLPEDKLCRVVYSMMNLNSVIFTDLVWNMFSLWGLMAKKKKKDAQESGLPARVTLQVQMGGGDSIRFGK